MINLITTYPDPINHMHIRSVSVSSISINAPDYKTVLVCSAAFAWLGARMSAANLQGGDRHCLLDQHVPKWFDVL